MSERLTSINLPGVFGSGVADYGRKTVPEMIDLVRSYARNQKTIADAILDAPNEAFRVQTYIGVNVRKQIETLQLGTEALKSAPSSAGQPVSGATE